MTCIPERLPAGTGLREQREPPFQTACNSADTTGVTTPRARQIRQRVEASLDRLRPGLLEDGGNVEVLEVEDDGTVRLEFQGTCATCPAQAATLRHAIEPELREHVDPTVEVVAVSGDPTPAAR